VQLSDEVYRAVENLAAECGKTPEVVAAESLAQHVRAAHANGPQDAQAAWAKLRRHFGSVRSGNPHGADAASIDADLAREYSDGFTS
jgi:hypothetical protein